MGDYGILGGFFFVFLFFVFCFFLFFCFLFFFVFLGALFWGLIAETGKKKKKKKKKDRKLIGTIKISLVVRGICVLMSSPTCLPFSSLSHGLWRDK